MNRYSDFGIKTEGERKMFNCPQVSISDVINCEIEVIDYIPNVKTQHGEGRYLIHFRQDGKEAKFFSNSSNIKSALEQISEQSFPFITTIRCSTYGKAKTYQFTQNDYQFRYYTT